MSRWLWALVGGVVLVAIAAVFWTASNRTNVTPPVSPGPAPVAPAPSPPAPAPVVKEPAPASAPAAQEAAPSPSHTPEKQTAPEPAPQPATAPSPRTAEKEIPPTPAATAPTGSAPTAEKEAAPASSSAPAGEKAPIATDKDVEPHANDKASAELAALQPGFVPKDLVAALNDSVISFASDSADVPASMMDFLQKAAEDLKQLPKGHVVEIAGYTDSTGDQALNVALSQRRAEAVRQTLIKFGAEQEMLIAKGLGSVDPVASNDTPEGRRRNRRIEYHIVKTP
jgi:outer membrane protein OmpA-like peptidoglycan-associated protein